jgi:hypothetical protein
MEEKINKEITPSQYFDYLKGAKNTITTEALKKSYDVFIALAEKYKKLGQIESLKKLCFLADTLAKEEKLIDMGVTTYVYRDAVEDYIENVADKAVKIVELSRYMREIPDELVETIEKVKPIFDEFYVVFTDYTGKEERKIEKERRDKDPILFGVFKNNTTVADRFYFIGDWVDEYCDLTLDKMITEYTEKKGYSPMIETGIPTTSEELVELLKSYKIEEEKKGRITLSSGTFTDNSVSASIEVTPFVRANDVPAKKGFFEKVRSVFKKEK